MKTPYPSGAAVCLCKNPQGEQCLIAIPAFEKRQILKSYAELKTGDPISSGLIPWAERPAEARAMFIANDFGAHFDLRLFFAKPNSK